MAGLAGSFAFPGNLTARFTTPSDETFLLDLFIEARPWLSWAEGSKDFIRNLYEQQYKTMRAGQEAIYPEHVDLVIEKAGDRVGRLVVDLGYADWRVSEPQILTEARGKGIGSDVLRGLQMAAGKMLLPISLSTPMVRIARAAGLRTVGIPRDGRGSAAFPHGVVPPGAPHGRHRWDRHCGICGISPVGVRGIARAPLSRPASPCVMAVHPRGPAVWGPLHPRGFKPCVPSCPPWSSPPFSPPPWRAAKPAAWGRRRDSERSAALWRVA
ncbi:hypothetical protein [Azospirillum sp.]|uniref:hypothetical protein n=1 Tax=Azospirillum sp. TaxID=34012 RepID=UPI002630862E|nr:hypothetical protein [Azospirillum sp.]